MQFTFNTDMPFALDPAESRIAVYCELHRAVLPSAAGPGCRAYVTVDWVDGLERELSEEEEAALLSGEHYEALERQAEEEVARQREIAREEAAERRFLEQRENRDTWMELPQRASVGCVC